ncbi:MAG TPA: hypothetical protein DD734_04105 [Firmicutes bacterium]|nr:hypothetical protein [Bacillota bacterium]HBR28463.1 hypothetical protein [Bacillota bacterium]HBR33793.1 hypothetical protein [Bacillota bacterium]
MGKTKIPPAVVKNFLFLNLLVGVTLVVSALGLHYFLRPRAIPALARPPGGEQKPIRIMGFWEIETVTARRLLFEGMPILKHHHNP